MGWHIEGLLFTFVWVTHCIPSGIPSYLVNSIDVSHIGTFWRRVMCVPDRNICGKDKLYRLQ